MRSSVLPLLVLIAGACQSDRSTAPRPNDDPIEIARNFEALSDSMSYAGNAVGAEVMHHVAEIVKLTGRVTPVEISIDGVPMRFLAVTEQIDHPISQCVFPGGSTMPSTGGGVDGSDNGGDSVIISFPCQPSVEEYYSTRSLIAWQPDSMQRIVRIMADTGRSRAPDDVPDVMAGIPTAVPSASPDTVGGFADSAVVRPVFYPGFFGEYFEHTDGWWQATQGTEANSLVSLNGACTRDTLVLDWARFTCERAQIAFEVSMTVEPGAFCGFGDVAASTPRAQHAHKVEMRPQVVGGVHLRLVDFQPPPLPPEPRVAFLPSTLHASVANGVVSLTFSVSNDSGPDLEIEYGSGQSYDFEIFGTDGSLVWRWSDGKGFITVFRRETLGRGKTLTFVERWGSAPHRTGDYTAVARLASSNVHASSKVAFRLP